MENYTLKNGFTLPALAYGTWQVFGDELSTGVNTALDSGYTSIDTAFVYENEEQIGKILAQRGQNLDEITITTKVWNEDQGYDKTMASYERSLKWLGKIDMLLIHWPGPDAARFADTWRAFEKLYEDGKLKAIGVCNFKKHHLETLLKTAKIVPMVNQIETNPYMVDEETIAFCKEHGILVEAWSPLAHGAKVFTDPVIGEIAAAHGKTNAQVVIRFLLEMGLRVLPKSKTPQYIRENLAIFDFSLTDDETAKLRALNVMERVGPDPDTFF
ncbi:aldo/keto reductase [Feifania hominis]|uniref:Aldo/keto reductase n=1 Tax=Feifania hominis TaxID=2763660 RepID=A0A926HUT2_9FIRM|nr:aldo/keto reductase [Feifania hominis]MBC8536628.1 aldo/keto reductase [Feifania hominis]